MCDSDYETLKVKRGASKEEIRRAYKRLCLCLHPDKNGNAEDFIRVVTAYQRLMAAPDPDVMGADEKTRDDTTVKFYESMTDLAIKWLTKYFKRKGQSTIVTAPIDILEIYRGDVKKLVIRVKGGDSETCDGWMKSEVYIRCIPWRWEHTFEEKGDHGGPLVIRWNVQEHPVLSIMTRNHGDPYLCCRIELTMDEWSRGCTKTIECLNQTELVYTPDMKVGVEYEIAHRGLYVDEHIRGPLYVVWSLAKGPSPSISDVTM
jgi:hypothetical protein